MEYAQLMCSKRQEIMRKSIDPLRLNDRFVLRNKSKNESVTTNSDSLDSSTYNDLPIKHSKSADIFQEDGAKICDMPRLNKSVRVSVSPFSGLRESIYTATRFTILGYCIIQLRRFFRSFNKYAFFSKMFYLMCASFFLSSKKIFCFAFVNA